MRIKVLTIHKEKIKETFYTIAHQEVHSFRIAS